MFCLSSQTELLISGGKWIFTGNGCMTRALERKVGVSRGGCGGWRAARRRRRRRGSDWGAASPRRGAAAAGTAARAGAQQIPTPQVGRAPAPPPLTPHTPIYILIIVSRVSIQHRRPRHTSSCLFRRSQINHAELRLLILRKRVTRAFVQASTPGGSLVLFG